MKKTLYFDRNGESGNIFHILSMVEAMIGKRKANECGARVLQSNSYDEALAIIEEYVHLKELSKMNWVCECCGRDVKLLWTRCKTWR